MNVAYANLNIIGILKMAANKRPIQVYFGILRLDKIIIIELISNS